MTCGYDYIDDYDDKNIDELNNLLEKIHTDKDMILETTFLILDFEIA